jgi:hypothetical protein
LNIPLLPPYDPASPESLFNALADAPEIPFRQSWLAQPDPAFAPATVRLGWRDDQLALHAGLDDDHVFTSATSRNQPLHELGDTLEVFVGISGFPAYIEYHYAPNSTILQLHWPRNAREIDLPAAGGLSAFAIEDNISRHHIRSSPRGWEVLASIALGPVLKIPPPLKLRDLDLNFGRYDRRDAHTPPILSATAPLPARNFHDRPNWHRVTCGPARA